MGRRALEERADEDDLRQMTYAVEEAFEDGESTGKLAGTVLKGRLAN